MIYLKIAKKDEPEKEDAYSVVNYFVAENDKVILEVELRKFENNTYNTISQGRLDVTSVQMRELPQLVIEWIEGELSSDS